MSPRVVGIDLSLTSTGLADSDGRTERVRTKPLGDSIVAQSNRLGVIVDEVLGFVDWHDADGHHLPDLVVIEGPSYASTGGQQHTRGGLWWLTVDQIRSHDSSIPILAIPPTTRVKYATGRGNASKDEVLAAAVKRYQRHGFDVTGNDIADATLLAAIGSRLLGHPIDDPMPQVNLSALAKVVLPDGVHI